MSQQLIVELFKESNDFYHSKDYAACVAMLTDCILIAPYLSALYCNRGVANHKQYHSQLALQDLKHSVQINHLNHVAYFNLFSINYMQKGQSLDREETFRQLVYALSSAYTLAAQPNSDLTWAQRSLYYCPNNKESIVIKALAHINYDREMTLKYLYEGRDLQTSRDNFELVNNYVQKLEKQLNKEVTSKSFINNFDCFKLKTQMECPSPQKYDQIIDQMVREYNEISIRIKQTETNSHQIMLNAYEKSSIAEKQTSYPSSQQSSSLQAELNIQSNQFIKIEEQSSNKQLSENEEDECEFDEEEQSLRLAELHIKSILEENSFILENHELNEEYISKINSYNIYPLSHKSSVLLFIEQAFAFLPQNNSQQNHTKYGYAILQYHSKNHHQPIRTAVTKYQEELCRWEEWSEAIELSDQLSEVTVKLYNKSYTEFYDEIVGTGNFVLKELGFIKVPLFNDKGDAVGVLQMLVEKSI